MADKKFSQFLDGGEMQIGDQVVGLRSGDNYRFDFPGDGIKDGSGNYLFKYATVGAAAVNYPVLTNSLATQSVTISANGPDTNIGINIDTKAAGLFYINASVGIDSVINDSTMAAATATNLSTSQAIKDYINSFGPGTITSIAGTAARIFANGSGTVPQTGAVIIDIASTYVGQTSITTVGTITTGTWNGTAIPTNFGGTGVTSYTLGDILYASAAAPAALSKLAGNTTIVKQYLSQTGDGALSAAPAWATISGGDITGAALTKVDDTNVTLTLGGTPATALLRATSLTLGWTGTLGAVRGGLGTSTLPLDGQIPIGVTATNSYTPAAIGSGTGILVGNGAGSITVSLAPIATLNLLANLTGGAAAPTAHTLSDTIDAAIGSTQGNLLYRNASAWVVLAPGVNGQFLQSLGPAANIQWTTSATVTPAALTKVDDTNVTLTLGGTPATALLQATSLTLGWTGVLSLAKGGSNANLTANNGGIFYSTATAGAILAGTATARQMLQSGATAAPAWSTAVWPATTTINEILYSFAGNDVRGITAAQGGVLISDNLSVPSMLANPTATGRVLTSVSGAAPVWSTPTYPSTSGATGAVIISDGTNNIYSTSLWPNTVGTSGKVVISNGTSNVYSTPTFPNASATTRKIIVSDGTDWVASTETYAVPGTSANVMTSDGTNWTSAAPAAAATTTITDDTTTNATMYPIWVTASTGSLPLKVSSTKLSFNPSTGLLTTTAATVGNLSIGVNTISSTNAGGDIILSTLTTGVVEIGANSTKASRLRFREDTDNGTNYTTIGAAASLAGDTDYTLPDAYPATNGYVLASTTGGVMSWVNVAALTVATIAGTSDTAVVNTTYIALSASQTTLTLPTVFNVGDIVELVGATANTGGWVLTAAAGDTITVNNAITSAGGTVTSAAVSGQSIKVICDVANTSWIMINTVSTILTTA